MAIAGTLSLTGTLTGESIGTQQVALEWDITAGKETTIVGLSSGDNTLSPPTGTTLVIVTPPTTNAVAIKVKGAAGDTGVLLNLTKPTVLTWASGPLIINAASAIAAATVRFI